MLLTAVPPFDLRRITHHAPKRSGRAGGTANLRSSTSYGTTSLSRGSQRLSIDDPGRHGDLEFASEPLELHVLDACLAERSRLRRDVPEQKREEHFVLIPKVDTLFVPEELHEFPGRHEPSRSIALRGSTAQPHCLHESIVMVARERDQRSLSSRMRQLGREFSVQPPRCRAC